MKSRCAISAFRSALILSMGGVAASAYPLWQAPTKATAPAARFALGDVNLDTRVDLKDLTALILALESPERWANTYQSDNATLLSVADFTKDGRVDRDDVEPFAANAVAPGQATPGGPAGTSAARGGCTMTEPNIVDLDVDSDNTNGLDVPDRSSSEDTIEDTTGKPGKIIRFEQYTQRPRMIAALHPTNSVSPGLSTDIKFRLIYPTDRIKLWKTVAGGSEPGDRFLNDTDYEHVYWFLGDLNGDGCTTVGDIGAFVSALVYPEDWGKEFPDVPFAQAQLAGDINHDGYLNVGDIGPFSTLITSQAQKPVPVLVFVESIASTSPSLGDIRVELKADLDDDGTIGDTDDGGPDYVRMMVDAELGMPRRWGAGVQVNPFSTVNLENGNVLTAIPLTTGWDPYGPPIQITLYHNSLTSAISNTYPFEAIEGLPPGWRVSYGARVFGNDGDPTVTVVSDDGRRDVYTREASPNTAPNYRYYAPPAGVFSDLRWLSTHAPWAESEATGAWVLTSPSQWKVYFTPSGASGQYHVDRVADSIGAFTPLERDKLGCSAGITCDRILGGSYSELLPFAPPQGFPGDFEKNDLEFSILQNSANPPAVVGFQVIAPPLGGDHGGGGNPGYVKFEDGVLKILRNDFEYEITVTFDSANRIGKIKDVDDAEWTYAYESNSGGRISTIQDTGNAFQQSFTFHGYTQGAQRRAIHTDRRGYAWEITFDDAGNQTQSLRPQTNNETTNQRTTAYAYDDKHNLLSVTNGLGNTMTYSYNDTSDSDSLNLTHVGLIDSMASPLTGTAAQKWDNVYIAPNVPSQLWNFYRRERTIDPMGHWTRLEYTFTADPTLATRIIEIDPDSDSVDEESITEIAYYNDHDIDPLAYTETSLRKGYVQWVTDANNGRHEFQYDQFGFPRSEKGAYPSASQGLRSPGGTRQADQYAHVAGGTESSSNSSGASSNPGYLTCGCPKFIDCFFAPAFTSERGANAGVPLLGTRPLQQPTMNPLMHCAGAFGYDQADRLGAFEERLGRTECSLNEVADPEDIWLIRHKIERGPDAGPRDPLRRVTALQARYLSLQSDWFAEPRRFEFIYAGNNSEVQPVAIIGPDGDQTCFVRSDGVTPGYDPIGRPAIVKRGDLSINYSYDAASRVTREDYGSGAYITYTYDAVNRLTCIKHHRTSGVALQVEYVWNKDNTLDTRIETENSPFPAKTSVVTFEHDNRKRLIGETRVETVGGGAPVLIYELAYTYDGLGNRLTRYESVTSVETHYFYDVDHHRSLTDPEREGNAAGARGAYTLEPYSFEAGTADNRLLYYYDYIGSATAPSREVRYQYYIMGEAATITVKDNDPAPVDGVEAEQYRWYRNLSMYYSTNGQLWRALWDRWQKDGMGTITNYEILSDPAPREFYFNGAGGNYLTRKMSVVTAADGPQGNPYRTTWSVANVAQPDSWSDRLGLLPWNDFDTTFVDSACDEDSERETQIEFPRAGYLLADGIRAQQRSMLLDGDSGECYMQPPAIDGYEDDYFHADLVGATLAVTDESGNFRTYNGGTTSRVIYTAFGEVVRAAGVGGLLPSSFPELAYAGGYAYEQDALVLDGAIGGNLPPLTLSHVGARWYDARAGRFIQRDPIGLRGGLNAYNYCGGRVDTGIDPDGLQTVQMGGGATTQFGPLGGTKSIDGGYVIDIWGNEGSYITAAAGPGAAASPLGSHGAYFECIITNATSISSLGGEGRQATFSVGPLTLICVWAPGGGYVGGGLAVGVGTAPASGSFGATGTAIGDSDGGGWWILDAIEQIFSPVGPMMGGF